MRGDDLLMCAAVDRRAQSLRQIKGSGAKADLAAAWYWHGAGSGEICAASDAPRLSFIGRMRRAKHRRNNNVAALKHLGILARRNHSYD